MSEMNPVDRTDPVQARKNAWHQSTLSTLLDGCSWQYFLQYQLDIETPPKPASVVGVSFHSAVELHERARAGGTPEGVTVKEMLDHVESEIRAVIDDDDLVTQGRAAVRNWYDARMKDGSVPHREWLMQYDPVSIEPYFNLPLVDGAKPIAGWIDGVYRHKETGEYILVDQKTARSLSRWGADGENHRTQAAMYAVALSLSPDFPEISNLIPMHYLVSRTTRGRGNGFEPARRVTVQPDLHDAFILGERIRKAEEMVASEQYVKKPEWGLCKAEWCPFYAQCMETGELSGSVQSVREKLQKNN